MTAPATTHRRKQALGLRAPSRHDYAVSFDGPPLSLWRCPGELAHSGPFHSREETAPSDLGSRHLDAKGLRVPPPTFQWMADAAVMSSRERKNPGRVPAAVMGGTTLVGGVGSVSSGAVAGLCLGLLVSLLRLLGLS